MRMVRPSNPLQHFNSDSIFVSLKQRYLFLLSVCSSTKHLSQIHAQIEVHGLHNDAYTVSELIRFSTLSSPTSISYARTLLYNSKHSEPISWNLLIRSNASSVSPREALQVFVVMRSHGVRPNNLTYPYLLKACAMLDALLEGKQLYADVLKHGLQSNVYVQNALIHLYGTCNEIMDARKLFDGMRVRSVVSWNSIITAYVKNSQLSCAIDIFIKMRNSGFVPDETTMVILFSVFAELGILSIGRWAHSQVIGKGMVVNCQLGTAIVDMYAKCGALQCAKLVFNGMKEKNVWTWSAMILGLAQHGYGMEALELFDKMRISLIRPNYVTFISVLCACSHAGKVEDGYKFFWEMKHIYGIEPMMIHYGAVVDILGRAARLKEAYSFVMNMPVEPDPVIWRTLLSACSIHDVNDYGGVGSAVKMKLLELEPRRGGNLVIVANMYAEIGMWGPATKIRTIMKDRGLKKMAGESWLDLEGSVCRFFSGNDPYMYHEDIYLLLDGLNLVMKTMD